MTSRMNSMCEKTPAYTAGESLAQSTTQLKMPINTFGDPRVVNGPPESPMHKPLDLGWIVQSEFEWRFLPSKPRWITHSSRFKVVALVQCRASGRSTEFWSLPFCKFGCENVKNTFRVKNEEKRNPPWYDPNRWKWLENHPAQAHQSLAMESVSLASWI